MWYFAGMKKVKRKVSNKRPQSKKGREVDEEDEDSDEDENRVEELVDMELLKQEMEEAIKHMQIELTKNVTLRPSTGKVTYMRDSHQKQRDVSIDFYVFLI